MPFSVARLGRLDQREILHSGVWRIWDCRIVFSMSPGPYCIYFSSQSPALIPDRLGNTLENALLPSHQRPGTTITLAYSTKHPPGTSRPPPAWTVLRLVSTPIHSNHSFSFRDHHHPGQSFLPPRRQTFPPLSRGPFSPSPPTTSVSLTIREISDLDRVGITSSITPTPRFLRIPLHHPISHSNLCTTYFHFSPSDSSQQQHSPTTHRDPGWQQPLKPTFPGTRSRCHRWSNSRWFTMPTSRIGLSSDSFIVPRPLSILQRSPPHRTTIAQSLIPTAQLRHDHEPTVHVRQARLIPSNLYNSFRSSQSGRSPS